MALYKFKDDDDDDDMMIIIIITQVTEDYCMCNEEARTRYLLTASMVSKQLTLSVRSNMVCD